MDMRVVVGKVGVLEELDNLPLQDPSPPQLPVELLEDVPHPIDSVVLVTDILTAIAVEFVDLLVQPLECIFVGVNPLSESPFANEEGGDVEMEQFSIVDELLGPPDLLGFGLLEDVPHGSFEHGCDDVPVLEDGDSSLLVLEWHTHH